MLLSCSAPGWLPFVTASPFTNFSSLCSTVLLCSASIICHALEKRESILQGRLEDVAFQLRIPQRKPWQAMADNVAAASAVVAQRDKVRSNGGTMPLSRQGGDSQGGSVVQVHTLGPTCARMLARDLRCCVVDKAVIAKGGSAQGEHAWADMCPHAGPQPADPGEWSMV